MGNFNYISNELRYNINFFEISYNKLLAMNINDDNLLNKVSKRISLLRHINKYSEEANGLLSDLHSNVVKELNCLSDTKFIEILKNFLTTKKIKISVNIMTLNEERCIARCIESIQDLADEIIILDTGSTDKTREIIRNNFPDAKLYRIEWKNDFSECRNRLIDYSTGDWVLQIDADEHLEIKQKDIREFLELLYEFPISPVVICPKIKNHDNQELDFNKRIFRKKDNLKYFGIIHEDLRYDIQKKGSDLIYFTTDFTFNHDGYKPEIRESKNKCKRNLKLQHKMMHIEPDNIRWYYFLAREQKQAIYSDEEVVNTLVQGIENSKDNHENNHFYLRSLLMLADIYDSQRDFEALHGIVNELSNRFPYCIDGLYYSLINNWANQSSQISNLIQNTFQHMRKIESPFSIINSNGYHMFYLLGMLYFNLGNYEKSFQMFSIIKDDTLLDEIRSKLNAIKDNIENFSSK
ncbi:glycosyl transferase 2 family protein [Bacillus mycoides]|uniref:glycosyltransferase family 2 protein n=1 Tax=Bacillus mycoides TaxID=1405 RepID=UPI0001A052C8|nr:glycosyltransferase family 2 protein [Bacillus mycoides]AIW88262.1 glycosyl transferase 2 family protein [Bacillus mycoides]EEL02982.1 hypothetical protein bcere0014_54560 [Bacillus cereus BDRD-ST196]GAE43219.1 hypothetical protein BW1_082_00110 [Bacillus mycoides NBRC 101238 = DSM 11821]